MALEIKLTQKLSQSLVMTPQLQQAIRLLQLGRHEYLEVIENELLENPTLEEVKEEEETSGERQAEGAATDELPVNGATAAPESVASSDDSEEFSELKDLANDLRAAAAQESSFEEFQENWTSLPKTSGKFTDDERPSLEASVSEPEGLVNHVLWQLRTTDLLTEDEDIAVQILGNIDRDGYLQSPIEELALACERSTEDVERVLQVIQTLDPPGVAARDLRECLLIQLLQQGQEDSLIWRIVSDHLHQLEIKRYDLIARAEKISVEDVYDAVKCIQKLEPRPGRPFIDEAPIYITPDIYVRKVGDDFVISLNEAGIPRLRVNPWYQTLLENGELKDSPNREYVQDRLKSAAWLIKSIHQRQQTIYKVTESIMKFQREFLDSGIPALKPLVLKDIAGDVGMHESTVSRVTTNKYVHTPQGVYELKFFFTSGLRTGGGAVSSESVKERIRALIANEEPRKPLSDQAIVDTLKSEGVDIARRTVAKYREMMNILSSSRRKKVF